MIICGKNHTIHMNKIYLIFLIVLKFMVKILNIMRRFRNNLRLMIKEIINIVISNKNMKKILGIKNMIYE